MTHRPPQAGLPLTVPLGIPTYWTPEEALAIFELLDDLREQIWAIYGVRIQQQIQQQRQPLQAQRRPQKSPKPSF